MSGPDVSASRGSLALSWTLSDDRASTTWRDHASPVFPDGPRGNRTYNGPTSGARKARSRTWGPHLCGSPARKRVIHARCPRWAPYDLCVVDCTSIANHSSGIHDLLFACPPPLLHLPGTQTGVWPLFPRFPPFLTVSLITGVSRAARVILPCKYTPPSRLSITRNVNHQYRWSYIKIGIKIAIRETRLRTFLRSLPCPRREALAEDSG